MKRRMVHFVAALISMLALTFATSAFAGPATDFVQAKQAKLFDEIKKPSPDQAKVDALFDEMLDYGALAEGSLGPEWAARNDAEKAQFSDLLKQLVRRSYQKNLKKIADYDVTYNSETPLGSTSAKVMTTSKAKAATARDEPLEINFTLANKSAKWVVQDIETEGVSLVSSYRGQFTKIIKKDGFPALIQKMKDKLAKGDTG